MSSNFERLQKIIDQAYDENFNCLFDVEPRNLLRWSKPGPRWSGPLFKKKKNTNGPTPYLIYADIYIYEFCLPARVRWECSWKFPKRQSPKEMPRPIAKLNLFKKRSFLKKDWIHASIVVTMDWTFFWVSILIFIIQ